MKITDLTYFDGKILIAEVHKSVEELIPMLLNFESYKLDFEKLKLEKRQKEFLTARILLNRLLEREVLVGYDEQNKPFLKNFKQQISITHSGQYVAVMTHSTHSVGIDLEIRTDKVQRVASRFLSDIELRYFEEESKDKLEIAWAAKETLYKIIGSQVQDFASELEIFPFELNETGRLNVLHVSGSRIYRLYYHQNEQYTLVFGINKKIKL